jgi:hypothetical protein
MSWDSVAGNRHDSATKRPEVLGHYHSYIAGIPAGKEVRVAHFGLESMRVSSTRLGAPSGLLEWNSNRADGYTRLRKNR